MGNHVDGIKRELITTDEGFADFLIAFPDGQDAGVVAELARKIEVAGIVHLVHGIPDAPDIVEAHVRAGDDDDGNVSRAGVRRDFLLHRDAAERRQDQVEDHEICGSLFEDVERGRAVVCLDDIVTGKSERRPIHPPDCSVILDDEYGSTLHRAS